MKRILKSALLVPAALTCLNTAIAQTAVSSINENFNTNCPVGAHHPNGWLDFNPIPSTIPFGQWTCTAAEGRDGTAGIKCTGLWGSPPQYHLDTAFLISPRMNLSSYVGQDIFLRFDSKTTQINLGAKLSIVAFTDSTFDEYFGGFDQSLTPIIGNDDSSDWVTHQFDLSGFTTAGNFFLAFRYTSPSTSGSVWFLDNIFTTSTPLQINEPPMPTRTIPLTASGNSATGEVRVAFSAEKAGIYEVAIYDLVGRQVHRQQLNVRTGTATYILTGVEAHPGVYIVKMGNSVTFGTAKFVVQ